MQRTAKGYASDKFKNDFEAIARHVRTRKNQCRHFGRSGTSEKDYGVSAPLARTAVNATAITKAIARAAESARVRLNMLNSAQIHPVLRGDAAGARGQVTEGPTGLQKEARKSARSCARRRAEQTTGKQPH